MSDFSSTCIETAAQPPDPRKHVNYVQGMVLGVDDLQQDFAYHQHQNQWLARDAIGYGTLSGLKVEVNGTQVSVTPGTALSPRGQLIHVAPQQCAALDEWLKQPETQQRLTELGVNAGRPFTAYVVLCFRDCKVDELPIPGEPCRCDSDAKAPSRVLDDFRLELRLTPPAQREEDAVRDFIEWLRQVRTTSAGAGYASLQEFLTALRAAAQDLSSPLESPPDYFYGSPPESLVIPCCHLCDYLRAALHLWVTELRPIWQARWAARVGGGCGCHGEEQDEGKNAEECLLLAALHLTLGASTTSVAGAQVDDRRRPMVVHLRMLQELLLCSRVATCCNNRTFATLFALDANSLRIWVHGPEILSFTEAALTLEINGQALSGFTVARVDTSGQSDSVFNLNVFDLFLGASPVVPLEDGQRIVVRFDTRQIMENTSPPRTLSDSIREGCICFPDLADDFITVYGTVALTASSLMLNGDATGPVQANTVKRIQQIPVNVSSGLANNTALGYDTGEWHPVPLPQPSNSTPAVDAGSGQVGASLTYARGDHVHPLPPIPKPSNTLPSVYATPGQAGNSLTYARGDHVHPLPPIPQPSDVLPSVDATPGQAGNSLTYARGDHVHPIANTTGIVIFRDVGQSELRVTRPIQHQVPKERQVCIRLGLEMSQESSGIQYSEDTDSFFPRIVIETPQIVARFQQSTPNVFQILLRASDKQAQRRSWIVHWWAFPVAPVSTFVFGPEDNDPVPTDLIKNHLDEAPAVGRRASDLARDLGMDVAVITSVLEDMRTAGIVLRDANNRYRLAP